MKDYQGFGELCDQRKHKLAIVFDVPKKLDVWDSGCIVPCIHNLCNKLRRVVSFMPNSPCMWERLSHYPTGWAALLVKLP